jgi:hypothetical protein
MWFNSHIRCKYALEIATHRFGFSHVLCFSPWRKLCGEIHRHYYSQSKRKTCSVSHHIFHRHSLPSTVSISLWFTKQQPDTYAFPDLCFRHIHGKYQVTWNFVPQKYTVLSVAFLEIRKGSPKLTLLYNFFYTTISYWKGTKFNQL